MYYGKEIIVLPFSSDQFNIAYDVEFNNLGIVLDPNDFSKEELREAFNTNKKTSSENLQYWSKFSKERGTDYAARVILDLD